MIIKLYHGDDAYPLTGIDKLCRIKRYGGLMSLSFDIAPSNPAYRLLALETRLEYDGRYYLVKTINERTRRDISSVTAELDIDALKGRVWQTFAPGSLMFIDILSRALDGTVGWTVRGADVIPGRRSPNLNDVDRWGILEHLQNATMFGVTYDIDNKNRILTIDRPAVSHNTATGVYFTDELNLTDCNYKGSSADLCTRLYAYGKDGLAIALYNGGREYVENYTYTNKVIAKIWRDDRFTDPESLRDAAIEKLKTMAVPSGSFTCKIIDLAEAKPDVYGRLLSCDLYDVVTLIQRMQGTSMDYRIVEYKEYPDAPELNEVSFNAVAGRITKTVQSIGDQLNSIDVGMQLDRQKYNILARNVEANTARIGETYTIGETDAQIESRLSQTAEEINTRVTRVETETTSKIDGLQDDITQVAGDAEAARGKLKTELQSEISQTAERITSTVSNTRTNGATNYIVNAREFDSLNGWRKDYGSVWTMTLDADTKTIALQRSASTTQSAGWVTCETSKRLFLDRGKTKYLTVSLRIKASQACTVQIGWRYQLGTTGALTLGAVPAAAIKAGNVTSGNYFSLAANEWTDCYLQIQCPVTTNDYYLDRVGVYLPAATDAATGCPANTVLAVEYLQITDTATYEQRISRVEQTADGLTTEVSKKVNNTELATKISQSATAVQFAWNNITHIIQFANAMLNIKDKVDPEEAKLLFSLGMFGMQFYDRQGNVLGHIGLRVLSGTSYKSMAFNIDKMGKLLCWAATDSDDTSYIVLGYYKDSTIKPKGFHFSDNVYLDNSPLYIGADTDSLRTVVYANGGGFKVGTSMPFEVYSSSNVKLFGINNRDVSCYATLNMQGHSITNQSDARLKSNIQPAQLSALSVINAIQLMSFDWLTTGMHEQLGVIAQQLQAVEPSLVHTDPDTGLLSVKTTAFIPYLIKAVQELAAMVQGTTRSRSAANSPGAWVDTYTPEEKAVAVNVVKNAPKTEVKPQPEEVI